MQSKCYGEDLLAYYRQHYAGVLRSELKQRDRVLYERLRRDRLMAEVPTAFRVFPDPLSYFREHYAGVTRVELRLRDPGLYQRLRRDGLLAAIPLK